MADTFTPPLRVLAGAQSVLSALSSPISWPADTAIDLRSFAGAEIQITAVTGTIAFTRSFNDADYAAITAQDASYANVSPSAVGFYSLPGGGYLKWTGTGTVLVRGYN
jgi:hypothetical protein